MDDSIITHYLERGQKLHRKAAYQSCGETLKAVGLHHLIEVDAQQFSNNAEVTAEMKVLCHLYQIVFIFWILYSSKSD
jgi:hypothetical protein